MVIGLGTDMIEVERVAARMGNDSGFRDLIFSKHEIAYCEKKTNKFENYAARFAAKEAFFKALGTGWLEGTQFNEIEITHTPHGKPELSFLGDTAKIINGMQFKSIMVSLTHLSLVASAVVIIEK
jgi:holo-[acyl-carrier protein] synthase